MNNMEITAEYLEGKGWNKSARMGWIFKRQVDEINYGAYINKDGIVDLFAEDAAGYCYFAYGIKTQERFERLWGAITEND